jgi:hypothetical protein
MRPGTEQFTALHKHVFFEDAEICVIYDAYPKSAVHLLLLIKPQSLLLQATKKCLSSLTLKPLTLKPLNP